MRKIAKLSLYAALLSLSILQAKADEACLHNCIQELNNRNARFCKNMNVPTEAFKCTQDIIAILNSCFVNCGLDINSAPPVSPHVGL